MPTRLLFFATAMIAISVCLVTIDKFASLITPIAIYLAVVAVWHTVAANFSSTHTIQGSLFNSLLLTTPLVFGLQRILPAEYGNGGAIGQLVLVFGIMFIIAILYVVANRVVNDP